MGGGREGQGRNDSHMTLEPTSLFAHSRKLMKIKIRRDTVPLLKPYSTNVICYLGNIQEYGSYIFNRDVAKVIDYNSYMLYT